MYLCINKINIVMWKEKNLVPFVVKYLAKRKITKLQQES